MDDAYVRPTVYQPLRPAGSGAGLLDDEQRVARVQCCKVEGNDAFRLGEFEAALRWYTEAIVALLEGSALLRSMKQPQRARIVAAITDRRPNPQPEPEPAPDEARLQAPTRSSQLWVTGRPSTVEGQLGWTIASTHPLVLQLQDSCTEKERIRAFKQAEPEDRALLATMFSNGAEALHRLGEFDHALRWALATLAIDPAHKKAKARLQATSKNKTRLSAPVATVARRTACIRTQRHAKLQQEEQLAAAEVGGRREAITNSQTRKDRATAAAAERQRAEAAVAKAVHAERKQEEQRRKDRAILMATRLREIHGAPPLSKAGLDRRLLQPAKRPQSAPPCQHRSGAEAFCASGSSGQKSRRGVAVHVGAPGRLLNTLFKPARAANSAARSVRKQQQRMQGALNREAARVEGVSEQNAKAAAVGEKTAKERVATYEAKEQKRHQQAVHDKLHGARRMLQSYSSQDHLRGEDNKAKRERAARLASKRCLDTVRQRDERTHDTIRCALAALALKSPETDAMIAERQAAKAAKSAAAAAEADAQRRQKIAEARAKQLKSRAERASGPRTVSTTKRNAAKNALNKARDGQPIFDEATGKWHIYHSQV
eukprot:COSAG02_NODE_798_length_17086_cov_72.770295_2_plen_600_part_00